MSLESHYWIITEQPFIKKQLRRPLDTDHIKTHEKGCLKQDSKPWTLFDVVGYCDIFTNHAIAGYCIIQSYQLNIVLRLSFLKALWDSKVTSLVVLGVTGPNWRICHAFIYDAIDVEISHFTILTVFALMCFEVQNDNITLQSWKERLIFLFLFSINFCVILVTLAFPD